MQTLVSCKIYDQRGIGLQAEFALNDEFKIHLHKYSNDPNKEELPMWTWFEAIKSFNRRTKKIMYDDVPFLALAIQAGLLPERTRI